MLYKNILILFLTFLCLHTPVNASWTVCELSTKSPTLKKEWVTQVTEILLQPLTFAILNENDEIVGHGCTLKICLKLDTGESLSRTYYESLSCDVMEHPEIMLPAYLKKDRPPVRVVQYRDKTYTRYFLKDLEQDDEWGPLIKN